MPLYSSLVTEAFMEIYGIATAQAGGFAVQLRRIHRHFYSLRFWVHCLQEIPQGFLRSINNILIYIQITTSYLSHLKQDGLWRSFSVFSWDEVPHVHAEVSLFYRYAQ